MRLHFQVSDVQVDVNGHMKRVRSDDFWTYAAREWHRLYSDYVPYRTGALMRTVRFSPGEIEHTMPYARRIYEGNFHFRTDRHPKASRKWDLAAEAAQKPKLIHSLQAYVDSGRMNLGG